MTAKRFFDARMGDFLVRQRRHFCDANQWLRPCEYAVQHLQGTFNHCVEINNALFFKLIVYFLNAGDNRSILTTWTQHEY